jgi:hypothetical protein
LRTYQDVVKMVAATHREMDFSTAVCSYELLTANLRSFIEKLLERRDRLRQIFVSTE